MNPRPALSPAEHSVEEIRAAGVMRGAEEQVAELQARIRGMQRTRIDSHGLPTLPVVAELLGGELRAGVTYSVSGSTTLAMAMLAAPSRAGLWCGVVGIPAFGVEAAARWGIGLERLVLVPDPAAQWLQVTAAMADVMTLVLTRPPAGVAPAEVARLASRLRQRGATMIALGDWPQSEARLTVSENRWHGIGAGASAGHGHLTSRQVSVTVEGRSATGRPRTTRLWLPDTRYELAAETVHSLRAAGLAVVL
ncbi:hypothetical protein GCM10027416_08890 [Okibacterium endophyticum]